MQWSKLKITCGAKQWYIRDGHTVLCYVLLEKKKTEFAVWFYLPCHICFKDAVLIYMFMYSTDSKYRLCPENLILDDFPVEHLVVMSFVQISKDCWCAVIVSSCIAYNMWWVFQGVCVTRFVNGTDLVCVVPITYIHLNMFRAVCKCYIYSSNVVIKNDIHWLRLLQLTSQLTQSPVNVNERNKVYYMVQLCNLWVGLLCL